MTVTTSPRLGVTRWSAPGDPFSRAQMEASHAALEANAAMFAQGTLAARPAPGKAGRYYTVRGDTAALNGRVYYDDGAGWTVVGSNVLDAIARASAAGTVPLVAQGAASQTASLQEWQNSAGTMLAKVDKDGNLVAQTVDVSIADVGFVDLDLLGSSPSNPAAGKVRFFSKSADSRVYLRTTAGGEAVVGVPRGWMVVSGDGSASTGFFTNSWGVPLLAAVPDSGDGLLTYSGGGVITVAEAGAYEVAAEIQWTESGPAVDHLREFRIESYTGSSPALGSGTVRAREARFVSAAESASTTCFVLQKLRRIVNLAAGEKVRPVAWENSGGAFGALSITGSGSSLRPQFSVRRVG